MPHDGNGEARARNSGAPVHAVCELLVIAAPFAGDAQQQIPLSLLSDL
jgi:hypothetical protein